MQQKLKKLGISAMVLAAGFAYYLAARFFLCRSMYVQDADWV